MPPEISSVERPSVPAVLPQDFVQRAAPHELPEWMDEPATYAELRECLRDLAQVNRVTLAYRPTLRFVGEVASTSPRPQEREMQKREPLRIVDVGSGGGDTLRVLERWGRRRKISLDLTGVDLNPYAAQIAREFTP